MKSNCIVWPKQGREYLHRDVFLMDIIWNSFYSTCGSALVKINAKIAGHKDLL